MRNALKGFFLPLPGNGDIDITGSTFRAAVKTNFKNDEIDETHVLDSSS
jgi:hypothetical protein